MISERKRDLLARGLLQTTLTMEERLEAWNNDARSSAGELAHCQAAMILGRGPSLAGALQGALLLKEVAKIPAEGMSSGEFSHGPLEAISRKISVVVLGGGRTSTLQYRLALRSKALGASVLMLTPHRVKNVKSICFGKNTEILTIFPCTVLLELLAYHCALRQRLNPDQLNFIQKVTTRE